jgi:hypothetical protein
MRNRLDTESQLFSDRLRSIMREAGHPLSPTLVANEFNLRYWGEGITVHAARNWLNGVSLPKADKLRVLALWLQVKPQDLLFGPDPKPTPMGVEENVDQEGMSLADDNMLDKFRSLPYPYQRMVREIVAALYITALQDSTMTVPPSAPSQDSPSG